jgi:hypothetical protein
MILLKKEVKEMAKGLGTTKRPKTYNGKSKVTELARFAKVILTLSENKAGVMTVTWTAIKTTQTKTTGVAKRKTTTKKIEPRKPVKRKTAKIVYTKTMTVKTTTKRTTTTRKEKKKTYPPLTNLSSAFQKARSQKLVHLLKKHGITKEESALFLFIKELLSHLPKFVLSLVGEIQADGIDLEVKFYSDIDRPYEAKQAENGLRITMHDGILGSADGIWFLGISQLWSVRLNDKARDEGISRLREEHKIRYLNGLKSKIEELISDRHYHVSILEEKHHNAVHIDVARHGQQLRRREEVNKKLPRSRELRGKLMALELLHGKVA